MPTPHVVGVVGCVITQAKWGTFAGHKQDRFFAVESASGSTTNVCHVSIAFRGIHHAFVIGNCVPMAPATDWIGPKAAPHR